MPSLLGLAFRAPYLHDGCAGTLQERFSKCDKVPGAHGGTGQLTADQTRDLIAFMLSL